MDLTTPPKVGDVICYSYLWRDEKKSGLEEGRKDRTTAVIIAHRDDVTGQCHVFVLPITHTPPPDTNIAIEIPPEHKPIMGLDDPPSWVICNELNQFTWPGFDVRPVPGVTPQTHVFGKMPQAFFEIVRQRVLALRQTHQIKRVTRDG